MAVQHSERVNCRICRASRPIEAIPRKSQRSRKPRLIEVCGGCGTAVAECQVDVQPSAVKPKPRCPDCRSDNVFSSSGDYHRCRDCGGMFEDDSEPERNEPDQTLERKERRSHGRQEQPMRRRRR